MSVPNKIRTKTARSKPKGLVRPLARRMSKRSKNTLHIPVETLNALGAITNSNPALRVRTSPSAIDYVYIIDGVAWATNGHVLMSTKVSEGGHTGVIHGSLAKQVRGQGMAKVTFRTGEGNNFTELSTSAGDFVTENDYDIAEPPDFISVMPAPGRAENTTMLDAKYLKVLAESVVKAGIARIEFGFLVAQKKSGPVRLTGLRLEGSELTREDTEWLIMPMSS